MIDPDVAYWDRGVRNVPDMTGAKQLLDAQDLRHVAEAIGIDLPFRGTVLDVGCGTGRASQLCEAYVGADIAPSSVQYCKRRGLDARVVGESYDIVRMLKAFNTVLCISVFTHISREKRNEYLAVFADVAATPRKGFRLLVDIIQGDGNGDVSLWTSVDEDFRIDLAANGFVVLGAADFRWTDGVLHRYFWVKLA